MSSPAVTPTTKVISIPVGRKIYLYLDEQKVAVVPCTKPGQYQMDTAYHHPTIDAIAYAKNYPTIQYYWNTDTLEDIAYTRWMAWDSDTDTFAFDDFA